MSKKTITKTVKIDVVINVCDICLSESEEQLNTITLTVSTNLSDPRTDHYEACDGCYNGFDRTHRNWLKIHIKRELPIYQDLLNGDYNVEASTWK